MSDLERVARAMHRDTNDADLWTQAERITRETYLSNARAALEALMEPSEGMIEAGVTAELDSTLGSRVTNSWQAMLKRILEEGK